MRNVGTLSGHLVSRDRNPKRPSCFSNPNPNPNPRSRSDRNPKRPCWISYEAKLLTLSGHLVFEAAILFFGKVSFPNRPCC